MLNQIDPGRRLRAKIENGTVYALKCVTQAAVNRKVWLCVGALICVYISIDIGYMLGQQHMRTAMIKAHNLVSDCEVIVIPTTTPNTTELYQLCD